MNVFVLLVAFAFLPNRAGGEIILTTDVIEACDKGQHVAYSTSPEHETVLGCWFNDERMVHIKWLLDGSIRSYPISGFQRIQGV